MLANLNTVVIYCGILSLENVFIVVNYHGIFKTLVPGANVTIFTAEVTFPL
jgi:hypothetical protein